MHFLINELSCDAYTPTPRDGQTEPITFYPELYSDSLGSLEQWRSRDACTNDSQAQFRLVADNIVDVGNVVSCSA